MNLKRFAKRTIQNAVYVTDGNIAWFNCFNIYQLVDITTDCMTKETYFDTSISILDILTPYNNSIYAILLLGSNRHLECFKGVLITPTCFEYRH